MSFMRKIRESEPYVVCRYCAHTTGPCDADRYPDDCENCGSSDLTTWMTLEGAEEYSQSILDASDI